MDKDNWRFALAAGFLALSGCASAPVSRSSTDATIYSHMFEVPVIYGSSVFVDAVDGTAVDRSQGYALVPPGQRKLRVGAVDCMLPIAVITCLGGMRTVTFDANVEAGETYRFVGFPPKLERLSE